MNLTQDQQNRKNELINKAESIGWRIGSEKFWDYHPVTDNLGIGTKELEEFGITPVFEDGDFIYPELKGNPVYDRLMLAAKQTECFMIENFIIKGERTDVISRYVNANPSIKFITWCIDKELVIR